jgi:hypothetical protein
MRGIGLPPEVDNSFGLLQHKINEMPIYKLQGVASTHPRSFFRYRHSWISAETLKNWVSGAARFPDGLDAQDDPDKVKDAVVVLGAVLHRGAEPGAGGHSAVGWSKDFQVPGRPPRPPYIGLGHELIHAHHNQLGDQPGSDNGAPDTVLYEYLCVGLGHFGIGNRVPTENDLRREGRLPARLAY